LKKTPSKNRTGGLAQGESPEFKPQSHKKKKRAKEKEHKLLKTHSAGAQRTFSSFIIQDSL
jgi:hypothetical protein